MTTNKTGLSMGHHPAFSRHPPCDRHRAACKCFRLWLRVSSLRIIHSLFSKWTLLDNSQCLVRAPILPRCAARKGVLLLGFGVGSGVRSFANNLQHALLILGAVIVKLVREVRDKAPRWHRNGAIGIKLAAGTYPPSPGDYSNEVVDGMKVRTAHVLRGPFYEDDIGTRFAGVAAQYRDLSPNRRIVPFDLVGQFVSNGGRVEISGALTSVGGPQQGEP